MKLLAFCDSPTLSTGFACVARNLFEQWQGSAGASPHPVEIEVWGIGFNGFGYDRVPYKVYPAGAVADWRQPASLELFLKQLATGGYTHTWLMQDLFNLSRGDFPEKLAQVCAEKKIRSVCYFPVDAPVEFEWLKILSAVDVAVAYTEYGKAEVVGRLLKNVTPLPGPLPARASRSEGEDGAHGVTRPTSDATLNSQLSTLNQWVKVIPHGVDQGIFQPLPGRRMELRQAWKPQWVGEEDFLMVNANANSQRKDVARSLEILAGLRARGVPAKLLLHTSNFGSDNHTSLETIAAQLGLRLNVDWQHMGRYFGPGGRPLIGEADLNRIYNSADLYLTTTLGEGWGLCITDALASGLPVAVPMHTGCGEIVDRVTELGMGSRCIDLGLERDGLVQNEDNSRVRYRVHVDDAVERIEAYYQGGLWREKPKLNEAISQWLDWGRIGGEMMGRLRVESGSELRVAEAGADASAGSQLSTQNPSQLPKRYDYYLEFGGGLGDIFNGLWHRGQYNVLRDLQKGERARVVLITHNPFAKEIFQWHPKRHLFDVEDVGYWHGEQADREGRRKHNLPQRSGCYRIKENALGPVLLPVEERDQEMEFHPGPHEMGGQLRVESGSELRGAGADASASGSQLSTLNPHPFIVFAVTAGLAEKDIPPHITEDMVLKALAAGFVCVFTGRNYERLGRVEYPPIPREGVIDLIDKLSVPGTAELLRRSAGLVTCHSALNILGWHLNKPQLLLYPQKYLDEFIAPRPRTQWAFGVDRPDCVHGLFSDYSCAMAARFLSMLAAKNAAGAK